MNKTRKEYVLVYIDALTQKKTSKKLKDIKLDPEDACSLTLEDVLKNIEQKFIAQEVEIEKLKEDRQRYKNNMQKLLAIIEVLVNQTELNNMNINDLKAIKEEIENE